MADTGGKHEVLAKLLRACRELEDAVVHATPAARYDPAVISPSLRHDLSDLRDELAVIIHRLQESF